VYDPSTAPGGEVTIQDVCRLVGERLSLLPPFRWRLVEVPLGMDHPYWIEDPDFDLDFHIREIGLAPPGDRRQLAEQVARIVARPLDRSRPLWELYLIHGLEDGHHALLTKVHHAAVDGVSGAEVLGALVDVTPEGREAPPSGSRPERVPSQLEMLGRGLVGQVRAPLRALQRLPSTASNLTNIPGADWVPGTGALRRAVGEVKRITPGADGDVLERPTVQPPRTRFNEQISAHRRFAFASLSLDTVKAVKNAFGVTVNDVVVAACATAMREWLQARGELPDTPLAAMVPVSVRTEEQAGTFGNRVSAMFVPLATDEPDPRRRLQRTHETLSAAKDHHRALPAELLQDATLFIPPALAARAARLTMQLGASERLGPPVNLVVSNVPGPQIPLYCAGARLVAHYPVSVIVDGVGLNITVMSYCGHLDFGIVVDREMVDDAWTLMEAVEHAVGEYAGLRE
jgi:WS/DGAT/MGAT family acyltransferase